MSDDVHRLDFHGAANIEVIEADRVRSVIDGLRLPAPPVELVTFHVFIVCVRGEGRHMVDFHDHSLEPGRAIWVRPDQVQRWDPEYADFDAMLAVFRSTAVPDLPLFDRFLGGTATADLGADADRVVDLLRQVRSDLDADRGDTTVASAVLAVALRLFARHAVAVGAVDAPPGLREIAAAFMESVERHALERSVAWHASQIGASPRTVRRAAAAVTGRSPKELIDARLILEAQRRLAHGDEPVSAIARDLRFSEVSNFTKFFRHRTGHAPTEFRATASILPPSAGR